MVNTTVIGNPDLLTQFVPIRSINAYRIQFVVLYLRVKDFPVFLVGCFCRYCGRRSIHIGSLWTGARGYTTRSDACMDKDESVRNGGKEKRENAEKGKSTLTLGYIPCARL